MAFKIGKSTLPKSSSGGIKDPSRMSSFAIRAEEFRNRPLSRYSVKGSFKKGGKVKATGVYELHKDERVLNKKQAKSYGKKRSVKR